MKMQVTPESVKIDIISDATVSYVSYQNNVPLIREIAIRNDNELEIPNITIRITTSPVFSEVQVLILGDLLPLETKKIPLIDVNLQHEALAKQTEAERGYINVEILSDTNTISNTKKEIEILAYDQWAGTRSLPELLAAFSLPNDPIIDKLIFKSAERLKAFGKGTTMNGYQSKNRDDVWLQISALYSTIGEENVHYSEPPASFGIAGQKVRTPERILSGGIATCLDTAMLVSSCLEQAGLNPVVLLKKGHAWIGCWLTNTTFPNAIYDDCQGVRKRVASGEFIAFETTFLSQHPVQSLRTASEVGLKHLQDDDEFTLAVDIKRSRIEQIRPLPSKSGTVTSQNRAFEKNAVSIENPPELPPLDSDATIIEDNIVSTPQGRLNRWKAKLLDLTLRNKQINFKENKLTLPLYVPSPSHLEDTISQGHEWKFKPVIKLMEGDDPRSAAIAYKRLGEEPLKQMARQALDQKEIIALVDSKSLDTKLYNIFSATKLGLEEGGANTLFLALGFLRWTEDSRAENSYVAPILFVPVTLTRKSIKTGYAIRRHDDETIVNPTLLQLLKENFQLTIKGLDPLPTDDNGVDVAKIWQIFRLAVNELPKWEVTEDVYLGVFSFTKYLMWKDLQDRTEQLKKNKIVNHLIEHPHEPLSIETDISLRADLDRRHSPVELLTPLLADSSQLNAVSRASEGYDFALEGPPGTGKSQTITNLIAHTLGQGKTVLFVSEKMAALEVVKKRLSAIGLDPFCLELHSAKAKKTEVLDQLKIALHSTTTFTNDEWQTEATRLKSLRDDLSEMVTALHTKAANGLSAWDAINTVVKNNEVPAIDFLWSNSETHTAEDLHNIWELSRSIQSLHSELPKIENSELTYIYQTEWTNAWEDTLLKEAQTLSQICNTIQSATDSFLSFLGLRVEAIDYTQLKQLEIFSSALLDASLIPKSFIIHADNHIAQSKLATIKEYSQKRVTQWRQLADNFRPEVSSLSAGNLRKQWNAAVTTWWPKRVFIKKAALRQIAPYTRLQRSYDGTLYPDFLTSLEALNSTDAFLSEHENDGKMMLESEYKGWETDWEIVTKYEAWAKRFTEDLSKFLHSLKPTNGSLDRTSILKKLSEKQFLLAVDGQLRLEIETFKANFLLFEASLKKIELLVSNNKIRTITDTASPTKIKTLLSEWMHNRKHLRAWTRWQFYKKQAIQQGLEPVIAALEQGEVRLANTHEFVEFCYCNWWLKMRIDEMQPLRNFSSTEHRRKILLFQEADNKFQLLTEKYIAATLALRVPKQSTSQKPNVEMALLLREIAKQRAHLPVRKLLQGISSLLTKLKPCLLMSPLSVAQYLNADAFFDLIVFDEASQIPVWDAVGAIARGKQLIVVGDPKQLPPTNFFSGGDDSSSENENESSIKDLESILDECLGAGMPTLHLEWHYRSKYENLISFSNDKYYDSRLITFPCNSTSDTSVTMTVVPGIYDRGGTRTNLIEAEAIVKEVTEHFLDANRKQLSMGVVTFNISQKALIDKLLDEQMAKSPELEKNISEHISDRLFIKNLENVQGDERDIILFSICFGRDSAGKLPMTFGPLTKEGGQRRLNVAVTRARLGVKIFSSIYPEDIDLTRTKSIGVRDLKHYLEFAYRNQKQNSDKRNGLSANHSVVEKQIIEKLERKGWKVHSNIGSSAYKIEIAVVHPQKAGEYLMAIELDNPNYSKIPTVRDRDRLRETILNGLGWEIQKIWTFDWLLDPEQEIEKLDAKLRELLDSSPLP
jgi:hypothetical protein